MLAEEYLEGLVVNLFLLRSLKKESQLGALDLLFALGRDDLRVVRYCSWEGRPPCRPVLLLGGTTSVSSGAALERLIGLSALGDSWIFMWFPNCPWSTRRSTLPNGIAAPLGSE